MCPKLSEDQKNKKSSPRLGSIFVIVFSQVRQSRHILIANAKGEELFSVLEQKSVSKVLKTWYFAYSACQWGGGATAPSGYATAQRWRAVGKLRSDLTCPRFEPQFSRSRQTLYHSISFISPQLYAGISPSCRLRQQCVSD